MSTSPRQPDSVPMIGEIKFCAWLTQAAPGDELEYHRGFLVLDITPFGAPMDGEARAELARVAARAFDLAERGFVHLAQRRVGPDAFAYIAIARPRRGSRPISLSTLLPEEAA